MKSEVLFVVYLLYWTLNETDYCGALLFQIAVLPFNTS